MILWMSFVDVAVGDLVNRLCCGFVLGRRGHFSRRSSIQCDEISCIRDHLSNLFLELQIIIPKTDRIPVYLVLTFHRPSDRRSRQDEMTIQVRTG